VFKNISINESMYFLPEDGPELKQDLFNILSDEAIIEIWIKAFGFNLDKLLDKLLELDSKGIKIHILADYMQAKSPGSWNKLVKFYSQLKNSEFILTTAGVGSDQPSIIFHTKSMTIIRSNLPAKNFCGSCNFSDSGFSQANNVRIFESQTWSDNFIAHFNVHKQWALEKAAHKQIQYLLDNPVQIQDVELSEDNAELFSEIEQLKTKNQKLNYVVYFLTFLVFLQWLIFWSPIGK
jgi:HKD family nuclease